uniref:Uncharacterized protein n=1 Tax=Davidia involucrata TaxID=16924 RepID=A0A5B6YWC6_DAVIN
MSHSICEELVLDPPRMRPKGVGYGRLKGCLEKRKKKASKGAKTSEASQPNTSNSQAMHSRDASHLPIFSQQISTAFFLTNNQFTSPMNANIHNQFLSYPGMQASILNPNVSLHNQDTETNE